MKQAGIMVRQGTAYLPVMAQTEHGVYMQAEPVFTADLTNESLTAALEQVTALGNPRVPHPSQEEWRRWKSPVLKAAKVRSWKQMAQGGAAYSIVWGDEEIVLYISHPEDPAKWRQAPVTTRVFSRNASLRTIVDSILEDVALHPDLLKTAEKHWT